MQRLQTRPLARRALMELGACQEKLHVGLVLPANPDPMKQLHVRLQMIEGVQCAQQGHTLHLLMKLRVHHALTEALGVSLVLTAVLIV